MKESTKDFLDGLKKFGIVAVIFLLIALIGSSVKAPGWAIPVGTIGMSVFAWFTNLHKPKKTRIEITIIWGLLTALFTTIAVLIS